MSSSGHGRIFWVDTVRTVAIALVVIFHLLYILTLDNNLRPIGFVGVSLFFMVSGFVLARHDPDRISFDLGWIKKRYIKIASLYYPTLIAIALIFGTLAYSGDPIDIALHILFVNSFFPRFVYSIISAAWFLLPLLGLYIIFPFLNGWTKKYPAFVAVAALVTFVARVTNIGWVSVSLFFYLSEFCFGIRLAQRGEGTGDGQGSHGWHGWLKEDLWLLAPLFIGIITPVLALPYVLFFLFSLIPRVLGTPPGFLQDALSFVGKHTFEIFLFHEAVIEIALGIWNVYGLDRVWSMAVLLIVLALLMKISEMANGFLIVRPALPLTQKKADEKSGP